MPTPDEPTNAAVRPGPIRARTASTPRPSNELTTRTSAPAAIASTRGQGRLGVFGQVGLGQHDDRLGAAVPGDRNVALEPAQVQVAVERRDDKDDVEVGADDLRLGAPAGGLPDQRAPTRQHGLDHHIAGLARFDGHPVTDRREGGRASARLEAEAAADGCPNLAAGTQQLVEAAILGDDPGRRAAGRGMAGVGLGQGGRPAQWREGRIDPLDHHLSRPA